MLLTVLSISKDRGALMYFEDVSMACQLENV